MSELCVCVCACMHVCVCVCMCVWYVKHVECVLCDVCVCVRPVQYAWLNLSAITFSYFLM